MTNPVLVEVTRGNAVESRHRGTVSVVDAAGKSVLQLGDTDAPVFPRSAVKAIQALPLIESGAADAFGFEDADLALACASHSGEEKHVERARSMLARSGMDESCLECGGHWSSWPPVARLQALRYHETPPAICNNCSGKHSGFIATAAHLGVDPAGYVKPDHSVQEAVRGSLESVTGVAHTDDSRGVDGCSIPTYAVPLSALALGFARMATGESFQPERIRAAERLFSACMAQPFFVAGTDRFCTRFMELGTGRLFAKTGAEGVFCGAIPELGLGIALKCDDGGTRASEALMAAVCRRLLPEDDSLQPGLTDLSGGPLHNWAGLHVGELLVRLQA